VKLAVMQPYFFPYIGYWQLINAVDTFVIYDDVNFIKKGYINRNSLLLNGKSQTFTLELLKASQNKLINEIEIGGNKNKILKTIEFAYKRAPYFVDIYPLIESIFNYPDGNLAKFTGNSIQKITKHLNIDTEIIYSSDLAKNNSLYGQDKIINICKTLQSEFYLNSAGGKNIYSQDLFREAGISLNFLETNLSIYDQFGDKFISNLSIIDLLMFNNKVSLQKIINNYSIIK